MNPIQTGNLIRTLRQRRGLTQKTLAEQIGVSDKAVSKWERGCGLPDPALLSSLAEALNTDAENCRSIAARAGISKDARSASAPRAIT